MNKYGMPNAQHQAILAASARDVKPGRGGDRGGRRPIIGKVRSVKMGDDLWDKCLAQPEGAGPFIRQAIQIALTGQDPGKTAGRG